MVVAGMLWCCSCVFTSAVRVLSCLVPCLTLAPLLVSFVVVRLACQDDREILENYEMEFASEKEKKFKDKATYKVRLSLSLSLVK